MNIWIPITVAFIEAAVLGLLVARIARLKKLGLLVDLYFDLYQEAKKRLEASGKP